MLICDSVCTAPAALSLGSTAVGGYGKLSSQFGSNGVSIGNLTSTLVDMFANLGASDAQTTAERMQAYDGVAGKTTITIDKLAKTNSAMADTIAYQYYQMRVDQRKADEVFQNSQISNTLDNPVISTSLASGNDIKAIVTSSRDRVQTAGIYQKELANSVSTDANYATQQLLFMNSLDLSVPSPFVHEKIDGNLWEEYQKQLFFVWNFDNATESTDINLKRQGVKRLIALNAVNALLSMNIELNEPTPAVSEKTFRNAITAKQVMLGAYRRLLLDGASIESTSLSNTRSLELILNIQLAERNHLLSELLKTKKTKNNLLALRYID